MAIDIIDHPYSLPTIAADYTDQTALIERLLRSTTESYPVKSGNIHRGSLFYVGGSVYRATSNTAITGTTSNYVKLTPNTDKSELVAVYVSSLSGVLWNNVFNGYYDVLGSLYLFNEFKAFFDGVITELKTVLGQSFFNSRANASVKVFQAQHRYEASDIPITYSTGAWRTTGLNTEAENNLPGASLSSNQITLPAGKYIIQWGCILGSSNNRTRFQTRLQNITDATTELYGTQIGYGSTIFTNNFFVASKGYGIIEITSVKVFEVQVYPDGEQNSYVPPGSYLSVAEEIENWFNNNILIKRIAV